jgi:hypothetical protein
MTGDPVALVTETVIESFAHAVPAGQAHRIASMMIARSLRVTVLFACAVVTLLVMIANLSSCFPDRRT